jgi:ABC-type branched-subunit amino acid transport system ATPase component
MTTALRTESLSKKWGAFFANSDVTLAFAKGARHALIGPNGAGKDHAHQLARRCGCADVRRSIPR